MERRSNEYRAFAYETFLLCVILLPHYAEVSNASNHFKLGSAVHKNGVCGS
jgi:hypothetical protein